MAGPSDQHFVLCPGFMNDHGLWDRMAPDLATLGTLHFADQSQDDSLAGMAARALNSAPENIIVIGFSMGGYVAREIITQAPGRVRGLVLMNTSARPDTDGFKKRNRLAIEATRSRGFRGLAPAALKKALHPDRREDQDLLVHIHDMALRLGEQAFLNQLSLVRADGRPSLSTIPCPAMVIWSRQDDLRSLQESQELADGIPGARLEIIEDCGHMTPLEAPRRTVELISAFVQSAGG